MHVVLLFSTSPHGLSFSPFDLTSPWFWMSSFSSLFCWWQSQEKHTVYMCVGFVVCVALQFWPSNQCEEKQRRTCAARQGQRACGVSHHPLSLRHTFPGLHAQSGICLWTDNLVYNNSARNAHKYTHRDRQDTKSPYLCTVWLLQPPVLLISCVSSITVLQTHFRLSTHSTHTRHTGGHVSLCWQGSSFSVEWFGEQGKDAV